MNCNFWKASYVRAKIIHQSIYAPKSIDVQYTNKKYKQLFDAFDGKFNITDDVAYQKMIALLANTPLTFPGLLQRNVNRQQKECPDLVLSDIIQKIAQSDLLSAVKLEIIDRTLSWYDNSIDRKINLYLEENSQNSNFQQISINGQATLNAFLLKEIQNTVHSYQDVLNHLFEMSKKDSFSACFNNLNCAFSLDYNIKYINLIFKIISLLPMSERLFMFTANLIMFMKLNKVLTLTWSLLLLYISSVGMHLLLKDLGNGYSAKLFSLACGMVPIAFGLTSLIPFFKVYYPSLKDFENPLNFNNNWFLPIVYCLGIRQYLISFFY